MARPKQGKKRDRQFNVALTADEMATLRERAAEAGQPLIEYGRTALFGKPITAQGCAVADVRHHSSALWLDTCGWWQLSVQDQGELYALAAHSCGGQSD
jgi:hypothetical protein